MISDQIGRDLISCNIRSDPHDIKSGRIHTSSPGKKDLEEEEEKPSSTRRTPHPSYSREEEARETSSIIGLPLLNPSPSTIRPPPPRSEFQENGIGDHTKESPPSPLKQRCVCAWGKNFPSSLLPLSSHAPPKTTLRALQLLVGSFLV